MQNLYKYTRYFQPSETYNHKFPHKFITAVGKFLCEIDNDPPETTPFTYTPWIVPYYYKPIKDYYYNIFIIFARVCRVKLMWRDMLPPDAVTIHHGLWVIGESLRVQIWIHLANHYFKGYFAFENWIKKNCKKESIQAGYGDIRSYASHLLEIQRDTTYKFITSILEPSGKYEVKLESYIKEMFDLDYKKYNTDRREYYHAISYKFHHKRMLL